MVFRVFKERVQMSLMSDSIFKIQVKAVAREECYLNLK